MSKEVEIPPINWFGGMMLTRHLLEWSKAAHDIDDKNGFVAKLNRPNFINRVVTVIGCVNANGVNRETCEMIQRHGWFTDVSPEAMVPVLQEGVDLLSKDGIWKFSSREFGTLDFSDSPGFECNCEKCKGQCQEHEADPDDDDEE